MVPSRGDAAVLQFSADFFHGFSSGTVDNSAFGRVFGQILHDFGEFIFVCIDFVKEVFPVKSGRNHFRLL